MIRIVLTLALAVTLADTALAATVTLNSNTMVQSETETDTDHQQAMHDTATDGPLHYRTAAAEIDAGDVAGAALSGVDLRLGALRARSRAGKAPNSGATTALATATASAQDKYTVAGSGRARVNLTVYGSFSMLSDIPDLTRFANAFGVLNVLHNGAAMSKRLSTADPTDAFYGLTNGTFHRKMSLIFDVEDGDMFDVIGLITADIRLFQEMSAAYDIEVDVKAGLRVVGLDGATLTPGDGGIATPVPLPASGLMLLSPLAGLLWIRRRRGVRG